jgi:hypothetical protein
MNKEHYKLICRTIESVPAVAIVHNQAATLAFARYAKAADRFTRDLRRERIPDQVLRGCLPFIPLISISEESAMAFLSLTQTY